MKTPSPVQILISTNSITMGEWLTPKLTREQFREGYYKYLTKQIAVNDFNFNANEVFNQEAEAAEAIPGSESMTRRALVNALAIKFSSVAKNPAAALNSYLTTDQLKTVSALADGIVSKLKTIEPALLPLDTQLFMQHVMQSISASSMGSTAQAQEDAKRMAPQTVPNAQMPAGSGLKRGRKGRVMYGRGIANFGPQYDIDVHDLDNNKLTLRYKSNGRKVHSIPSNMIGGNMIACLKDVMDGNNPSYNNVNSLSKEEKDYLSVIGRKAKVDKLSAIDSGTKDEDEKDLHSFRIMTGEISAGNDNKQLVKDYKKLLLKLISKGRIDSSKGKSILLDLAVIGY